MLEIHHKRSDDSCAYSLDVYQQQDGSYILETERFNGILMQEMKPEEQRKLMPQIRHHLKDLHKLHSDKLGGPSAKAFVPFAVLVRQFIFATIL